MSFTVTTPAGTSTFASIGERDDFLHYLGVAFADVTVGSLDGLAGMAETNGITITWGANR